MSQKLSLLVILVLMSVPVAFSQTVANPSGNTVSLEIKKEAVTFLRETSADVNGLRTLENRISFSAELAGLMWFEDEKEARAMFQVTINDFRQLLNQYNAQINLTENLPDEEQIYPVADSAAGQLRRKITKAIAVRQQIATTIAEHDPKLALDFFGDTALVITNPMLKKQMEGQDTFFETRLLQQIAEKDVDTALKYARKSLEKGSNYETFGLLKKIYEKDADKGISFGEDVLAKMKSNSANPENFYLVNTLLNLGVENYDSVKGKPGKKPIYDESALRDLAEMQAQQILSRDEGDGNNYGEFLTDIERFAPSRAAQIRQKFGIKKPRGSSGTATAGVSVEKPVPPSPVSEDSPEKLLEKVGALDGKQLPKEEREKVVASSRKIISGIKDPNQKIVALTALAVQVAKLGDKELALEVMEEGRSGVNLQPKNYADFLRIWLLAGGYAQVNADKSFPLLEDAIFRLNDTISAFSKVAEFIDVNGDFIEDGEVQVGSFGGDITREMLRNLGTTDATIRSLAVADFKRTQGLANKFDRPEVRILAKMLVLRGILGGEKENSAAVPNE